MPTVPPSTEHIADSSVYRAALRAERLAARLALDPATLAELNQHIESHLIALLADRPPQTLAFCAPVKNEFDARPLASRLIAQGWRAAMPVVEHAAAPMVFRAWSPDAAMGTDRHGIPIPAADVRVEPDIVLLPLVAFDARGYRIGYGGGYFDRTLAQRIPGPTPRPFAIGVGFELGRVASIHPEAHDIPVDALVTEAGACCVGVDSG